MHRLLAGLAALAALVIGGLSATRSRVLERRKAEVPPPSVEDPVPALPAPGKRFDFRALVEDLRVGGEAVRRLNDAVWASPESVMAFADWMEDAAPELEALVARHVSLERVDNWRGRVVDLARGGPSFVARLERASRPSARIVVQPLKFLSIVTESVPRSGDWTALLPLSEGDADRLASIAVLAPDVEAAIEIALRSACRYTPAVVQRFEGCAVDARRSEAERALFVRALALSSEVHDDAVPKALAWLREGDGASREAAADGLARGVRMLDGTSPMADAVVAALRQAAERDPSERVQRVARCALARFDRIDAQASAVGEGEVLEHLSRPDSHGYRRTRAALIDRHLQIARDVTAEWEARDAARRIAVRALERSIAEGDGWAGRELERVRAELLPQRDP